MNNEQRIEQAFYDIDLSEEEEVLQASKKLKDIPKEEVIGWLARSSREWDYCELLYGIKNIEEVFGAKFNLERLIELYFKEPDHWFNSENTKMLEEFNQITGREISADDVAEHIDVDFVRESIEFDVGILGFIEFVCDNGGDAEPFVERIISSTDKLNQQEISEIICMADYISNIDNTNAEKLFKCVDWNRVKERSYGHEFISFFKKFAPDLVPQIV